MEENARHYKTPQLHWHTTIHVSHVQRFYQYCKVSKISISCRVTDKGRPVLLGNMTFTWTAPTIDFGTIRCLLPVNNANSSSMKICLSANKYILFSFVLSVVKGNRYTEVSSKPITFNAFPVSIRGFKIVKLILPFLSRKMRSPVFMLPTVHKPANLPGGSVRLHGCHRPDKVGNLFNSI